MRDSRGVLLNLAQRRQLTAIVHADTVGYSKLAAIMQE